MLEPYAVLLNGIGTFVFTFTLSILFVVVGYVALKFAKLDDINTTFALSTSYFIGQLAFAGLFRVMAFITQQASTGLYATILVFITISIRSNLIRTTSRRFWLSSVAIVSLLYTYFVCSSLAIWMPYDSLDSQSYIWGHFGSSHSGRYIAIAEHFLRTNSIETISQNFSESLVVLAHWILGLDSPFFCLTSLQSANLAALALLIYGLFRDLKIQHRASLLATFLVMFCNFSLSLQSMSVVEGNPFAFAGNADIVLGLGSVVGFYYWLARYLCGEFPLSMRSMLIPVVFGFSWNYSASQNILLTLGCLSFAILFKCLLPKGGGVIRANARDLAALLLIFGSAALLGACLGGMMSPRILRYTGNIAGVMAPGGNGSGVTLDPYLEARPRKYHVKREFSRETTSHQFSMRGSSYREVVAGAKPEGWLAVWIEVLRTFEARLWAAIRAVFFPLLGVFAVWICLRSSKGFQRKPEAINIWFLQSCVLLACGFFIAFFLRINGYKFELNRFLYPGMITTVISLWFVSIDRLLVADTASRARKLMFWVMATVSIFGPAGFLGAQYSLNYPLAREGRSIAHSLMVLIAERFDIRKHDSRNDTVPDGA